MQNTQKFNSNEYYYNGLLQQQKNLPGSQLPWLNKIRQISLENFKLIGFPTTYNEEWKYTNVESIAQKRFEFINQQSSHISKEQIQNYLIQNLSSHYMVFIDGIFIKELSDTEHLPKNVVICNLASALKNDTQKIEQYLSSTLPQNTHGFTTLNSAYINDGAFVFIPKNTIVDKPLQLLFLHTNNNQATLNQPRNLIVLEEFAQANVIEIYASLDNAANYLTNAVTELVINQQAKLEYVKIQQESKQGFHIGTTYAQILRDSHITANSISVGGKLVRSDFVISLAEKGASCELNGLYMAQHKQHVDHHTVIEHLKTHGTSKEFFRGIIADQARAIFNGKVFVEKDAQQTDAQQENHNLLLSTDAEIDTKPQLEIYANEVKCAHGATVGQLDEEALFYLKSRGIPHAVARNLLIGAFGQSVLDRVANEFIREHLNKLLINYLPLSPSPASGRRRIFISFSGKGKVKF